MAMAAREDIVISPLVQVLLDKLSSSMIESFSSIWRVEEVMHHLSDGLENIQAVLCVAEQRQIKDPVVKRCLEHLRSVAYTTEDLLDVLIYEVHKQELANETDQDGTKKGVSQCFSFSFNAKEIYNRDELTDVINEIKEKIVDIEKKLEPRCMVGSSDEMGRQLGSIQQRDTRQKSSSLVDESRVLGRNEDANHIKSILLSDQYSYEKEDSFVVIVGMGGLGKTTLAQLVYNDLDIQTHFDIKAWVCVSDDFNVEKLTRAILESAFLINFDLKDIEPLQRQLQNRIIGKRFLIVLDDVWYENRANWEILLVPFRVADKGSRIIVTSRSEKVASSIGGMVQIHKLQILSDDHCWSLFIQRAFLHENPDDYPNLKSIGWGIVKKCKGLPLVVNTLGGLLRSESDEGEWKAILESDYWNLIEDDILPVLSLSYHCLPTHLKQCFAYCGLFPKDYKFDRENLIRVWMAEDFIPSQHVEKMEAIGNQYFDDLFDRSFFQYSTESKISHQPKYVMHDLIHDLAQLVSGKTCYTLERDKSCDISEKVRRLSLITNNLETIDKRLYKCKNLTTFILHLRGWVVIRRQILHDLFEELRYLRVLDLSNGNIRSLPDSIGNLKCLKYLNLYCTYITELPQSICKLYNLQILILLRCCNLKELPRDIKFLTKLQHLVVHNLTSMPPKIGRLTCLKTLPLFYVGQNDDDSKIGELKELRHLQGAISIEGLENVVDVVDAQEANLKNKKQLNVLKLSWGYHYGNEGDVEVLEGLQPHTELKILMIDGYGGSRFPNWMVMDLPSYVKLKIMILSNCRRCEYLPSLGQLPFLEVLVIENMPEVKRIGRLPFLEAFEMCSMPQVKESNDHFSRAFHVGQDKKKGFQSLKFLMFKHMDGLEGWNEDEEGEFPCLQKLRIVGCRKLHKLPPLLPSVKDVVMQDCDSLTTLSSLPSISKLTLIRFGKLLTTIMPHLKETLEELVICEFERLGCWGEEDIGLQLFPRLKRLWISRWHSSALPKELHKLTSLEKLEIFNCQQLITFQVECLPPKLKCLTIKHCENLRSLPSGLSKLSSLEDLVIEGCNNMLYLPELPNNLHSLTIAEHKDTLITQCRGEEYYKIAHIPNVKFRKVKLLDLLPHGEDYWDTLVSGSDGEHMLDQYSDTVQTLNM